MDLRPRLCFLTKGPAGYGFHLHGERTKGGQFIRNVEPGSCADLAGLRAGDRVVEVNGVNVEHENHHQVVSRIREVDHRTRLLVVDRDTEDYLHSCGLACTEDLAVEMGNLSPRPSPGPTPSVSPIPKESRPASPDVVLTIRPSAADSPSPTITPDQIKRLSVTSSTGMDTEVGSSPRPAADPVPRLCHIVKADNGYGFNLHSNKSKGGQFVRSVDPGSPAQAAGIRPGDKLVEVNGVSVRGLKHSEVVERIRAGRQEVHLLVVDAETDDLFHRLGVIPTSSHVKEICVDLPVSEPPVIDVSPITNLSPKSRTNGSSASQSSRSSTTQSEISSSDMSIQVADEDEPRGSDQFVEDSLRLSPTAAEARQKALAGRNKKRAPPMDWSKKQEIFSNF